MGPTTVALLAAFSAAQDPGVNPRELGRVCWQRELEPALAAAKDSGKPVLLLFQEVPGCSTCVGFGDGPLSLAPMVEAIETLFVPVAIRNNVDGYEQQVRERFEEPAWNNPVVRLLADDGRDLVPRQEGVWQTPALLARMLAALEARGRAMPAWLDLFAQETLPGELERASFAMHCFWVGEAKLGALDGVVSAQAAWVDGLEVVDVRFRPERVSFAKLLGAARSMECASRVFTTSAAQAKTCAELVVESTPLAGEPRPAQASDHLHDLANSPLRLLPLTPLQALRVNAALAQGSDPDAWLSPRQLELARTLRAVASEQPERLAGLARPEDVAQLADYADRLRRALAGS